MGDGWLTRRIRRWWCRSRNPEHRCPGRRKIISTEDVFGVGGGERRRVKTYSASWQALGPGEIGQASDESNCCGDLHGGRWREVERGEVDLEVEVEL
jgi:hypothetical protein